VRLRHQIQTCQSTQRQVHRALGVFADHLIAATEATLSIQDLSTLMGELSGTRLLLNGGGR
jgi:hypothetical protein